MDFFFKSSTCPIGIMYQTPISKSASKRQYITVNPLRHDSAKSRL